MDIANVHYFACRDLTGAETKSKQCPRGKLWDAARYQCCVEVPFESSSCATPECSHCWRYVQGQRCRMRYRGDKTVIIHVNSKSDAKKAAKLKKALLKLNKSKKKTDKEEVVSFLAEKPFLEPGAKADARRAAKILKKKLPAVLKVAGRGVSGASGVALLDEEEEVAVRTHAAIQARALAHLDKITRKPTKGFMKVLLRTSVNVAKVEKAMTLIKKSGLKFDKSSKSLHFACAWYGSLTAVVARQGKCTAGFSHQRG